MRIRKPRGLTTTQLMVATVIGVIGGLYIYQPLVLENRKNRSLHNEKSAETNSQQNQIKPIEQTISK